MGLEQRHTTVSSNINDTVTSVTVASTTGFEDSGFIRIGTEVIAYTGKTATTFTGLTRGSGRSHIARACLEGMALQNVDLLNAMEKDLKKRLRQLRVDGGACANNLLMQMQSDFLGTKVIRPKNIETTALGAAFLAGLGVGLWKSTKEIKAIWKKDAEFKPVITKSKREQRLVSWHRAIKASQQ